MTVNAFLSMQDGKSIFIPANLKQNVRKLKRIRWKSFDVSPDNKWYKVKNGCLMSKAGDKLYGYVGMGTKVRIPKGVKYIAPYAFFYTKLEEIFVPKSVNGVGHDAFSFLYRIPAIRISEKNTQFVMENNCIYNKTTKRLVAAYGENGIINIPDAVTCIKGGISYGHNGVSKIIFPKSLKKLKEYWSRGLCSDRKIQLIFQTSNPPMFEHNTWLPYAVIYVPKGSKAKYEKIILENEMMLGNNIRLENEGPALKRVVIER